MIAQMGTYPLFKNREILFFSQTHGRVVYLYIKKKKGKTPEQLTPQSSIQGNSKMEILPQVFTLVFSPKTLHPNTMMRKRT
jgi:hypothetical protein